MREGQREAFPLAGAVFRRRVQLVEPLLLCIRQLWLRAACIRAASIRAWKISVKAWGFPPSSSTLYIVQSIALSLSLTTAVSGPLMQGPARITIQVSRGIAQRARGPQTGRTAVLYSVLFTRARGIPWVFVLWFNSQVRTASAYGTAS